MPSTTRRLNCPTCGDPVHLTHHCRGRKRVEPDEPPTPGPPRQTFRMMIAKARHEQYLDDHPPEQLELDL